MGDTDRFPTTMYVYAGFGTGTLRSSDLLSCRLVEQLDEGRRPESSGLNWSHYLECEQSVDIRDGVTRSAGSNSFTYADGDEVRIPDANGCKFVVVQVMVLAFGTQHAYKRVLLMRDDPVWNSSFWD